MPAAWATSMRRRAISTARCASGVIWTRCSLRLFNVARYPLHYGVVFECSRELTSNGLLVDARSVEDLSVNRNQIELLGGLKELPPDAVRTADCPNFSFQENPAGPISQASQQA